MARIRPSHYVLGIHGLAVLRNWFRGEEAAAPRVEDLVQNAGSLDRSSINIGLDLLELEVAPGYSAWAPVYDAFDNPLINAEQPVVRSLIDRIAAGMALDAACGTGRHAQYLRSRGHRVVALDMTPEMLAKARAKVSDASFCIGSLTGLPLKSASFDLAVCSLALDHAPELTAPIAELARVVRPGGWAIISDPHPINRYFGCGAFFQGSDGRYGFVRGFPHDHSEYISAILSAGFEIRECIEPRWGDAEVKMIRMAAAAPEAFRAAMSGMPIALVWLLSRR